MVQSARRLTSRGDWRRTWSAAFAAAALVAATSAWSDDYPERPIRLLVATSPSSAADIIGRIYAQSLSGDLGRQVIVDNRAGAGGNLGAQIAASAAPDGYTLFLATPAHVIHASLSRKPAYDLAADFVPVSKLSSGVYVIAANPALGARSIGQLIEMAKARPSQINYASGGVGNATHLAVELFAALATIKVTHLPYQGGGPALVALISGEAQFAVANLTAVLPHLGGGRLLALAVTSLNRSSFLPEVPSVAESGLRDYEVTSWFGVVAPKGTPRAAIAKLNAKLMRIAQTSATRQALAKSGAEPAAGSPAEFGSFLQKEKTLWAQVVKRTGIVAD